ncbi:MAG: hypothetical protein FJ358_03630 [Thaumarchaeota archaeon]|nr:hypothetical protein [Nitrososphaerota archaeon]
MNGLLFGFAKRYGMDSVGLYGETSGFGADKKAAMAILKMLEKILNVALDYSTIELNDILSSKHDLKPEGQSAREYIR